MEREPIGLAVDEHFAVNEFGAPNNGPRRVNAARNARENGVDDDQLGQFLRRSRVLALLTVDGQRVVVELVKLVRVDDRRTKNDREQAEAPDHGHENGQNSTGPHG